MRLTITVPAHNEAVCLHKNMSTLHDACSRLFADYDWRLVIAENGSKDETRKIADDLARSLPRVSALSTPTGKGAAIRAAWNAFPADAYAFTDADLSTDPDDLRPLVDALATNDLTIGSRHHPLSRTDRNVLRTIVSRGYNFAVRLLLGSDHADHQCGFKAIRHEAWNQLRTNVREDGFVFDTELLVLARAANLTVATVPVRWEQHRFEKRPEQIRLVRTAARMFASLWKLRRSRV